MNQGFGWTGSSAKVAQEVDPPQTEPGGLYQFLHLRQGVLGGRGGD